MATNLLATKLSIPPAPRSLVRRARLLDRLNEGARRKLTLVSAPAGCGKTTLLAEWAADAHGPVVWVNLDERDNDPSRFWTYVIAALGSLNPGAEAMPVGEPGQADLPEEALADLIGDAIAGIPGDLALVLDDYHLIANPAIHRAVTFMLDHSPSRMHVVIAGREDPPLPLALLRARNQLVEVRAGELSFTPAEAAAFLHRMVGPELPAQALAALQARTEGWIAGLQLAALSIREGADLPDFIQTFAGTHRYIVDYMAEQVLHRQDPQLQRFMLETSILDRLSGPSCDAVTGEAGGQATLERLERANLFVVPLDSDRRWYRYHQLFAGFLQDRLRQAEPGRWPELHSRAARWFEQQGDAPQAFEHWIKAGDADQAASLAEQTGRALLESGEARLVLSWLEQLPRRLVQAHLWLSIYRAYALLLTGQVAEAEACLQDVEQWASGEEAPGGVPRQELQGLLAASRAHLALLRGEVSPACDLLQAALHQLPVEEKAMRSLVYNALGGAHLSLGDVDGAERAFEQAARIGRESGSAHMAVPPALNLTDILVQQGRLHQALETLQEVLRLGMGPGAQPLAISAHVYCMMAEILYRWNDLEAAAQSAEKAVVLSRRGGSAEAIGDCAIGLAWICRAQGHVERAQTLFLDVEQMVRRPGVCPPKADWWAANLMRWWVRQGQYSRAARLAGERGLAAGAEIDKQNEALYAELARLLLAQGKPDEALRLLGRVVLCAEAAGRQGRAIEVLVLQTLALQAHGENAGAAQALHGALSLAEPEDYVRVFVDEGAPMARLLQQAQRSGPEGLADYVDRLLAACGSAQGAGPARPAELIEPLGERELQILRLIAAGKTYQEIARELIIAVSTVQHYVKSLYPKLGVHSGLEAVARARQLGLLA